LPQPFEIVTFMTKDRVASKASPRSRSRSNGQGHVLNARITRSSGSATLDQETLALVKRAQPLPAPPPDVGGAQIAIAVPIRYRLHLHRDKPALFC